MQRLMMRSASRLYLAVGGVALALLLVFLFAGLEITGAARDLLMRFRARGAAFWLAVGRDEAVWPLLSTAPIRRCGRR